MLKDFWSKGSEVTTLRNGLDESNCTRQGGAEAGERFESATWVHKAQALPNEEFKREVERHLTGRETEAWELLYFKLYESQLAVVERALETLASHNRAIALIGS